MAVGFRKSCSLSWEINFAHRGGRGKGGRLKDTKAQKKKKKKKKKSNTKVFDGLN
jgi:hypothetical protein